jgi:hypothetical protein
LSGKSLVTSIPSDIKDAGFYNILNSNNEKISAISLNYDRKESYLDTYSSTEIEKYISNYLNGKAKIIDNFSADVNLQLKELSQGKQLWQLFILIGILFLIAEILIIKLMKG